MNAVSDILMPPKLQFFCFIVGIMQLFLTKYQSDKPMIPYLYSNILELIKKLMQLTVKPDLSQKCESYLDFRQIDLDDKESVTKCKYMSIGFAARQSIQELRKNDEIRNSDVVALLSELTKFIVTFLKKLFEKSPAGFNFVKNASISNPHTLRNERVAVVQRQALIQTFYASSNWMLPPFVKIIQRFILNAKHLKKGLNRGGGKIFGALFGQYQMLP